MAQYRTVVNGVPMIVTTVTKYREPFFVDPAIAREAVETLYRTKALHPFVLHGFVIMPDHCHLLVCVPKPETISRFMNVFKSGLTFNTGIPQIWQRRFHIKTARKKEQIFLRYIHNNPVVAGLVERPETYPWSSACGKWNVDPFPS
ncbi:MAG: transposase [Candidatus Peribacteraceae bacterium]|nr:transposase [Candidatus Peribacteraceae bacterium]